MKTYIEINTLRSGQPRPYADSEYIVVLTFTREDGRIKKGLDKHEFPHIIPYYVDKTLAFPIARLFCYFEEPGDSGFNWASRTLQSFERLDPTIPENSNLSVEVPEERSDRWKIHVRAAYTD